jgi:hypothetical protein
MTMQTLAKTRADSPAQQAGRPFCADESAWRANFTPL